MINFILIDNFFLMQICVSLQFFISLNLSFSKIVTLNIIKNISINDLNELASASTEYNLHMIVDGIFKKNCDSKNASQVDNINNWIKEK